jgi:hypothetical protein
MVMQVDKVDPVTKVVVAVVLEVQVVMVLKD